MGELNDALCDANNASPEEEDKQPQAKANLCPNKNKGGKGRGGKRARSGGRKAAIPDNKAEDLPDEEEEVPEDSLEEMFVQLSSHGADYLRSLGEMISNALESLDSLVVEQPEEEQNNGKEGANGGENDKIKAALVKMEKMGYTDEGGWLTQLLVSTDCDVGKALAVIKPENPEKKQD